MTMTLAAPQHQADADTIPMGWRLGYQSLYEEITRPRPVPVIKGSIPFDLRGVLYRNGPGAFEVQGEALGHWFDGDGMVHAISLAEGRATYMNRFIATEHRAMEARAGRRLFAGFMAPPADGLLGVLRGYWRKNTANTNIVYDRHRLMALSEAGWPYVIDPIDLHTVGPDNLGLLEARDTYSAHPKRHPLSGALWNFGLRFKVGVRGFHTDLRLYHADPRRGLRHVAQFPLPCNNLIHDFGLTPNRAIFALSPLCMPRWPLGLMSGRRTILDTLRWDASMGTRMVVVDLNSGAVTAGETDPFLSMHVGNAWEEGSDTIVDLVAYPDDRLLAAAGEVTHASTATDLQSSVRRVRVCANGQVTWDTLYGGPLEMPAVHPLFYGRRCNDMFCIAGDGTTPMTSLPARVCLSTGTLTHAPLERDCYAGECVAVPKPQSVNDQDAYVLSVVLNANTRHSELRIYDGRDLARGDICRIELPFVVPTGFHGTWCPALGSA